MAKRPAAGDLQKRSEPPRRDVVRCNNAMALWHCVLRRPAVLAPVIGSKCHSAAH